MNSNRAISSIEALFSLVVGVVWASVTTKYQKYPEIPMSARQNSDKTAITKCDILEKGFEN